MTDRIPQLLVVDDVPDNRLVLSRRFERQGFEVAHAEDGSTALEMINRHPFDVVLLDIVMPGIDGVEVLRRIRETHSIAELPVIMVTAKTEAEDVVQALEIGANDYITKPVNFAVALARVRAQINRKQAEEALRQANEALERHVLDLAAANRQLEVEIAGREQSEARVRHLADHDLLTGIGNRRRFREQMIRSLGRTGHGSLAVLVLNLDRFQTINETLGHGAGDLLLRTVAERLHDCIGDGDRIARLGGDEFGVIQTGVSKPEDAARMAERVMEALSLPNEFNGGEAAMSCSIGIAIAPNDGTDPEDLLRSADMALHRAKADGPGSCRFFEAEMNARAQARRLLEADLRKALSAGEFELFYQPLLDLASNTISGCEALLRWRHPDRGIISPAEFIPLAEENGLIVPIGEWVLRQACTDAARWPGDTKLAVNLSAAQFRSSDLLGTVVSALAGSGLAADRLELEITETLILSEDKQTTRVLHGLREFGAKISMDDFGTGYSSLSYLRKFPFDKIKIDQCFVKDMSQHDGSLAIVRAITSLASSLGMTTTAEGVETEEQLQLLKLQGCSQAQGYLISRPVSARDILAALWQSMDAKRTA